MKKQALSLAVAIAGAYPAASNALSLGDIESNSNLNQPLRAQIELLSANAQEARQLQVRLAPSSVFNRVGIDRPAFLDSLKFSSAVKNGKPVILVSSDQPISEPFVNFLLEVSWPNGQLLKEYTVMLDLPVLMQPGNQLAGSEAAVRAEPRSTGVVNRPEPRQVPAAQQRQVIAPQPSEQYAQQEPQEQVQAAPAPRRQVQQARPAPARQQAQARASTGSRTYRVRSGDTLFKVATRLNQPGTNTDQMMMALYRANPQAFIDNNINGLKNGVTIKAPAASAAKSISRAEARRQVRQHYADWKNFRGTLAKNTVPQRAASGSGSSSSRSSAAPGSSDARSTSNDKARLEVLGSKDKAIASDNVSAAGKQRLTELEKELALARESLVSNQNSNAELKSKVDELESMLRKKNRLIALRDDQLAELQKQLSGGSGTVAAVQQQANMADSSGSTAADPVQQQPVQPELNSDRPLVDSTVQTPDTAGDIQNYVGNTAGQDNTIVRAQPPVTETNQANMTPAQRAAAAAATLNNNGAEVVREPEIIKPLDGAVQTTDPVQPASPFAEKAEGNDLISMLTSPLAWKIGAGALLSLLLLGLLSRLLGRRKSAPAKHAEFDDGHFDLDNPNLASADVSHDVYGDLESQLDKAESGSQAFNDPFGTHDTRGLMGTETNDKDISLAKPDQEEDEVLMEANVYIAYGLHQQAESELKKALEKHPERLEYRHKLLENYFAANNREAFDQNALAFLETRGSDRQSKLWQDIAGWGNKISPDNAMYALDGAGKKGGGLGAGVLAAGGAAAAAVAGAATTMVSSGRSALDDGKDALSHAFDSTPDLNAGRPDLNVSDDLDLGLGGLSDDDLGMDDFDFDLDDLERELGAGESEFDEHQLAVSAPAVAKAVDDVVDHDLHEMEMANTVADADMDFSMDDFAHELQSDAAAKADMGSLPSMDLSMDDFDLDVSGGESLSTAARGLVDNNAPDLMDDALDFNFDDEPVPVAVVAPDQEVVDFDLDSLAMEEPETSGAGKVAGMAAAAAGVAGAAVAAVGQKTAEAANKVTNLNLHLDKESGIKKILPQDTFYTKPDESVASADDDWLGDIDDALSFLDMPDEEIDLHEAHISTKLDLARAYLDMGDIEGARSTLEEVMVEGNDNQRKEAETLLHQTG